MKLRVQISLTILGVFALLTVANFLVQHLVVGPSYQTLENSLASQDAERVNAAIEREVQSIDRFALEWSDWDDAYKWIKGESDAEAFVQSNFAAEDYWEQCHTPVFIFTDATGKVLFSSIRDPETYQPSSMPEFAADRFEEDNLFFPGASAPARAGIIVTSRGPTLIVSRPVVTTDGDAPSVGRFIAARFLTDSAITELREQVGVDFSLLTGSAALGATPTPSLVTPDSDTIIASKSIASLKPGDAIAAQCRIPRSVSAEGQKSSALGLMVMLVSAGAITVCLIGVLQHRVVAPIVKLRRHAADVGATGDLSRRLNSPERNEIGQLAGEFDAMVASLEDARREVSDMSRRAGMAEVASGVLHNVGNAMNSATVSMSTLRRMSADSKSTSLKKVAALLASQSNLADFFANDPRAQQLPGFIAKLADGLEDEHTNIARECERLDTCLAHVNEIVSAHQDIAHAPEVAEQLSLESVLTGAASLVRPSLDRHGVTLLTAPIPSLTGGFHRAKLQQVLVNFLTNAAQAVKDLPQIRRVVSIRSGTTAAGRVWIEVSDQGPGFTKDQRANFFRQGYTTKSDGHGVGLHYCAITIEQLRGEIDAWSDGPDQGATFRIEFPVDTAERRAAA